MKKRSYDSFALDYDEIMGDQTGKVVFLQEILKKYAISAKTILEIACGTGNLIKQLEETYIVTGLEYSQKMLAQARMKLPSAKLYQGDMRNFSLSNRYDVIICLFDSINHLLHLEEWKQTFEAVHNHLHEGGIFVVDINTEYCLSQKVLEPAWIKEFSRKKLVMNVQDATGNTVDWCVQVYDLDSGNLLYEEHIYEASFPVVDVTRLLEGVFSSVTTFDSSFEDISDTTKRVFFVSKK